MLTVIIGSGASAVACATGLLSQGHQVTMIDSCPDLIDHLEINKTSFNGMTDKAKRDFIFKTDSMETKNTNSHPRKLFFGVPLSSNFDHKDQDRLDIGAQRSLALGGLTNVWGATMLPFFSNNPSGGELNFSQREDALEVIRVLEIPLSVDYAQKYLENRFYPMPLAISKSACQLTGYCLSGCPNNAIWSARSSIQKLNKSKNFNLKTNTHAVRIEDSGCKVKIFAIDAQGVEVVLESDHVFIAAGPINTYQLLVDSGFAPKNVTLSDSAMTIVPSINLRALFSKKKSGRSLSSEFISFPYGGKDNALAQIYPPSLFVAPKVKYFANRILNEKLFGLGLFKAISVIMIYQSSLDSKSVSINAHLKSLPNKHELEFRPFGKNHKLKLPISTRLQLLRKGLFPFMAFRKTTSPGSSIHYGSTFTSGMANAEFKTNSLGRLGSYKNISIVDSSVLSQIPAGPITLSIMMNAYMIGKSFKNQEVVL